MGGSEGVYIGEWVRKARVTTGREERGKRRRFGLKEGKFFCFDGDKGGDIFRESRNDVVLGVEDWRVEMDEEIFLFLWM